MTIKTKSIQEDPSPDDGIRICIMRRIKPEFTFHIWMPTLAPSTELLQIYHEKVINWQQFEKQFTEEVLDTQLRYLQILLDISKRVPVTLLCWEETPAMCHRRLVTERLQEMEKDLRAILR